MERDNAAATKGKVRAATQVYSEAVSIIALRAILRSITPHDSPEGIRQRIRDLIAVKSEAMGLDVHDMDERLEQSDEVIGAADKALEQALRKARK